MVALGGSVICYTLVFLRTSGYIGGGRFAPAHQPTRRRSFWPWLNTLSHGAQISDSSSLSKGFETENAAVGTIQRVAASGNSTDVRNLTRKLLLCVLSGHSGARALNRGPDIRSHTQAWSYP